MASHCPVILVYVFIVCTAWGLEVEQIKVSKHVVGGGATGDEVETEEFLVKD